MMRQNEYLWSKVLKAEIIFYLFTRQQILDSSKLKEFADNNFKFDKNG